MKTRVKNEQFEAVKSADLIGIKWRSGEKGILLKAKEGIICLNNDVMDTKKCFATLTKSEYLGRTSVKKDLKKVFKFEKMGPLLKWFAKK